MNSEPYWKHESADNHLKKQDQENINGGEEQAVTENGKKFTSQ